MHVIIIISTASSSKQYRIFGYLPSHSTIQFFHLDSNDLVCGRKTARNVFYIGEFAQFTLRAYWLVLCIPRSDDAPACQVALSNARGTCLLPTTNRNADSIANSALTTFVSGKAKSHPGQLVPYSCNDNFLGGHVGHEPLSVTRELISFRGRGKEPLEHHHHSAFPVR